MLSFLPFSRFYAHFLPASLRCVVGGFTLVLEVGGCYHEQLESFTGRNMLFMSMDFPSL